MLRLARVGFGTRVSTLWLPWCRSRCSYARVVQVHWTTNNRVFCSSRRKSLRAKRRRRCPQIKDKRWYRYLVTWPITRQTSTNSHVYHSNMRPNVFKTIHRRSYRLITPGDAQGWSCRDCCKARKKAPKKKKWFEAGELVTCPHCTKRMQAPVRAKVLACASCQVRLRPHANTVRDATNSVLLMVSQYCRSIFTQAMSLKSLPPRRKTRWPLKNWAMKRGRSRPRRSGRRGAGSLGRSRTNEPASKSTAAFCTSVP